MKASRLFLTLTLLLSLAIKGMPHVVNVYHEHSLPFGKACLLVQAIRQRILLLVLEITYFIGKALPKS